MDHTKQMMLRAKAGELRKAIKARADNLLNSDKYTASLKQCDQLTNELMDLADGGVVGGDASRALSKALGAEQPAVEPSNDAEAMLKKCLAH